MGPKAISVDAYLAALESEPQREALNTLRRIIASEIPEAEEVISYGIPTFKFHGMVASFAAFKNHCSFFPGHTAQDFAEELKEFKVSKGTVQFTPDHPIPEDLLRKIVRFRADENRSSNAQR